jgi:hypothetical protein
VRRSAVVMWVRVSIVPDIAHYGRICHLEEIWRSDAPRWCHIRDRQYLVLQYSSTQVPVLAAIHYNTKNDNPGVRGTRYGVYCHSECHIRVSRHHRIDRMDVGTTSSHSGNTTHPYYRYCTCTVLYSCKWEYSTRLYKIHDNNEHFTQNKNSPKSHFYQPRAKGRVVCVVFEH